MREIAVELAININSTHKYSTTIWATNCIDKAIDVCSAIRQPYCGALRTPIAWPQPIRGTHVCSGSFLSTLAPTFRKANDSAIASSQHPTIL